MQYGNCFHRYILLLLELDPCFLMAGKGKNIHIDYYTIFFGKCIVIFIIFPKKSHDFHTKKRSVCPTSHKEVGQLYSPAASDIASQWYSAHAEWYLLRKFLEANKISLKPQGFNITIAVAIISLRRSRNIILAFSADSCYNE